MMRDARLNLIGEGANDVLRCFISMVGLRHLGKELESMSKKPWTAWKLWRSKPPIPVRHGILRPAAESMSYQINRFYWACVKSLGKYREQILDKQFVQARLGDTATELFLSGCVFSRLASMLSNDDIDTEERERALQAGLLYLKSAARRNAERLTSLRNNDDEAQNRTANVWLS
jgi:alkylation response protein AidB-like acyl-CoA dehydrogenase